MLIILRGTSGSGKSTLARMVFRPEEIVSSDQTRLEMYGSYDIPVHLSGGIWPKMFDHLEWRCSNRMLTCFDATNLKVKDIKKVTQIAEKWGEEYHIISINTPVQNCIDTLNSRVDGKIEGAIVPLEVFERQRVKYDNCTPSLRKTYGDSFYEGSMRECRDRVVLLINSNPSGLKRVDVDGGTSVFLIGDIHGQTRCLKELLARIPANSVIFSVGDVLDRGDSFGSLRALVTDPRFGGLVMGNHEYRFLVERFRNEECRSNARKITHEDFDALPESEKQFALNTIRASKIGFFIQQGGIPVIATHAGVGGDFNPKRDSAHLFTAFNSMGDAIRPVSTYTGQIMQVHGHSSWEYTGDFSGTVVNIDSHCYKTKVLTAFNPFTREVIQT